MQEERTILNQSLLSGGYRINRQIASVFFLSISSGIPFLLLLSTLSVWLIEDGITKTTVGLFAWATLPYSCKGIIAPFIDRHDIPLLSKVLGKRRSWLIVSQLFLIISILMLGWSNPARNINYTAICALIVGCFSALQDIIVEAYRAEVSAREEIGITSTASVLGYRVGMLASGAGAIYCAALFHSWAVAYSIMAMLVGFSILATLLAQEPSKHFSIVNYNTYKNGFKSYLQNLFVVPLKSFAKEYNLLVIILFLVAFKVPDTVLNVMTNPFLLELGFSKLEIAHVAKSFGIFSMIAGGIYGGFILVRNSFYTVLLVTAVMQLVACLLFYVQAILGYNLGWLLITMGIENFVCGLGQVVLIAYLSKLAHCDYTATRYAVLSSIASLIRVIFSSVSGAVADAVTWADFYSIVFLASIPCIMVLAIFRAHFTNLD